MEGGRILGTQPLQVVQSLIGIWNRCKKNLYASEYGFGNSARQTFELRAGAYRISKLNLFCETGHEAYKPDHESDRHTAKADYSVDTFAMDIRMDRFRTGSAAKLSDDIWVTSLSYRKRG